MNVIIEELETKSTGSSNNIYTSSTKILSDGSEGRSLKDIDKDEEKKRRPSNLVHNLEKDNPGIIH